MVDYNDLRVSHPHEIVEVIGRGYPKAQDRASRLRQVLNAVYQDQRAVSLQAFLSKPKKQVKALSR